MKKLFVCLMAICLGFAMNANAQTMYSKQKAKQAKKEYKQKVKSYQKDGWKIFGSSHTLEMALLEHYEALEKAGEGAVELTGFATSTSEKIGSAKLKTDASESYAQMVSSNIRGRITEDMGSTLTTEELEEFEHFYAAYESKVATEIRGELHHTYSIYRAEKIHGKDAYKFQAYYIVDEAAASRARIRAFENAAKESAVAQKYADKVHQFIEEAFEE
jgi:hypothetical protein